ncbi:TPA: hypothetical protein ENS27_10470 [bacterium]|nr:hypothetical protein [bacterium]
MVIDAQTIEKNTPKIEFKANLSLNDLISALKMLDEEDREFFIENLIAALSPEYLKSIEEARRDYKKGRVLSHEDVFK